MMVEDLRWCERSFERVRRFLKTRRWFYGNSSKETLDSAWGVGSSCACRRWACRVRLPQSKIRRLRARSTRRRGEIEKESNDPSLTQVRTLALAVTMR